MQIIAAIERDLYTVISESIVSERVIITDERVEHIRQRHPGDWEHYSPDQQYVFFSCQSGHCDKLATHNLV